MNLHFVERPGYFGKKRDEVLASYDSKFGKNRWTIGWDFGGLILPFYQEHKPNEVSACQVYEDGYFEFLKSQPELLEKLVTRASEVYDTAPTNVQSGFDYSKQETINTHIHDIAIRRSVARLGKMFLGKDLVQVRSSDEEWWVLSPCKVPFHLPNLIQPDPCSYGKMKDYGKKGKWWLNKGIPLSVEEWYQNNKMLFELFA